ncbi:MAG: hemin uptake protein HemP [Planctomycetota bacterium]|jgi:hemin uptake protein HemP
MENNNKKIRYSGNQSDVSQGGQVPVFDTQQLFGDSREVRLHHCGEEYRLTLTKNNKLILTK